MKKVHVLLTVAIINQSAQTTGATRKMVSVLVVNKKGATANRKNVPILRRFHSFVTTVEARTTAGNVRA